MSASATDLFRESAPLFQTTLGAAMLATDTAATLADVVGMPTTTGVTITVDQFNATGTPTPTLREVMTGVVSGSQIIDLIRGQDDTTAQSHANGAIVQMVFTSQANNDLMTGILAQHTQSGAHGAITTTSITNAGTLVNTGLITANGGLDVAGGTLTLPSGSINYADLLSTIFSEQVQSYTNSGTAGGTFYYINLGGIKLLWGSTSSLNSTSTNAGYTINYPSGFFSNVQSITVTNTNENQENQSHGTNGGLGTATVTTLETASNITTTVVLCVFIIGT